jgi:tetratricopeptide (TPR) repeat protein
MKRINIKTILSLWVLIILFIVGYAEAQKTSLDAKSYNNRGIAYQKKRQYDKAISDYSKAIEINPRYADAYNNRGNAYGEGKGQHDKAWDDVKKAQDLGYQIHPGFLKALREASGRQR